MRPEAAAILPAPPYRHSRVSGNPAVACRGCGIIRQYRRDSRLRGNDGGGAAQFPVLYYPLSERPPLSTRPETRNFMALQPYPFPGCWQ